MSNTDWEKRACELIGCTPNNAWLPKIVQLAREAADERAEVIARRIEIHQHSVALSGEEAVTALSLNWLRNWRSDLEGDVEPKEVPACVLRDMLDSSITLARIEEWVRVRREGRSAVSGGEISMLLVGDRLDQVGYVSLRLGWAEDGLWCRADGTGITFAEAINDALRCAEEKRQ